MSYVLKIVNPTNSNAQYPPNNIPLTINVLDPTSECMQKLTEAGAAPGTYLYLKADIGSGYDDLNYYAVGDTYTGGGIGNALDRLGIPPNTGSVITWQNDHGEKPAGGPRLEWKSTSYGGPTDLMWVEWLTCAATINDTLPIEPEPADPDHAPDMRYFTYSYRNQTYIATVMRYTLISGNYGIYLAIGYTTINDLVLSGYIEDAPGPEPETCDPVLMPDITAAGRYLTAYDANFITPYIPTWGPESELNQYIYAIYTQNIIDEAKKIFGDPFDMIASLYVLPIDAAALRSDQKLPIYAGLFPTGVSMSPAKAFAISVSCGKITLPTKYSGSWLDYPPATTADIWLPYVGYRPLDMDRVAGRTINVSYLIDIISGAAMCYVRVTSDPGTDDAAIAGWNVVAQYEAQMARQIPVTSASYRDMIATMGRAVAGAANIGLGGAVAMGTSLAADAAEKAVITATERGSAEAVDIRGGVSRSVTGANMAIQAAPLLGAAVNPNVKPQVSMGGAYSTAAAQFGVEYPYVVINRPISAMPAGYEGLIGVPANTYEAAIGSVSGYAQFSAVRLDIPCTTEEAAAIESALTRGVYL